MLRKGLVFGAALALFFACIAWMGSNGPIGRGGYPFIAALVAAHGLSILLWAHWPAGRRGVAILILAAVAARACMLPFPTGDDVHRYVWEGKIQHAGYNPYRYAPDDPELAPLRDANWEGVNHKVYSAIYPPGAQLLFWAVAAVSEDRRAFKVVFALFDIGVMLILLRLAALFGMERRHAVLYGLNPLVLVYFAGEAHLDPLYVLFFWAALLARERGRPALMYLSLGAAVTAKFVPIIFLPLLATRKNLKYLPLMVLPMLAAVPYIEPGGSLLRPFLTFLETFCYNSLMYSVYMFITPYGTTASLYCWITLCVFAAAVFLLVPDAFRACYLAAGALLVCAPCVHQWYYLLIVPFLPFFRSPAWLYLLAAVSASFVTRMYQYDTGGWADYGIVRAIEYVPFTALGLWLFVTGRRTGPRVFPGPRTVSVVIPALNDSGRIAGCIGSVLSQGLADTEIIVADGGSRDGTPSAAAAFPGVQICRSETDRARRVAAGVRRAQNDVVVLLDPGARLRPGALRRMLDRLEREPNASGGSLAASWSNVPLKRRIAAALCALRTFGAGVSTRREGQFFRRCVLEGALPDTGDAVEMELALRIKERGAVVAIPRAVEYPLAAAASEGEGGGEGISPGAEIGRLAWFILLRRLGLTDRGAKNRRELGIGAAKT